MKWNLSLVTCIILIFLYHQPVFSITHSEEQNHWFLTVGSGIQFPDFPANMKVVNSYENPPTYNLDLYSINNSNSAILTLVGGKRWQNKRLLVPSYSLGIFWQYIFNNKINGQVSQYSLPEMTNYVYRLNINSNIILVSGKMNLVQYQKLFPYIQGGIGAAFNNISNYEEVPFLGIIPRVSPNFGNTIINKFAFNIGAGIDLQLSPQWILSAGYLYQDINSIHSNPGQETWRNDVLSLGSLHCNELLAMLTFVI